jgi:hypothetical protein
MRLLCPERIHLVRLQIGAQHLVAEESGTMIAGEFNGRPKNRQNPMESQ